MRPALFAITFLSSEAKPAQVSERDYRQNDGVNDYFDERSSFVGNHAVEIIKLKKNGIY